MGKYFHNVNEVNTEMCGDLLFFSICRFFYENYLKDLMQTLKTVCRKGSQYLDKG